MFRSIAWARALVVLGSAGFTAVVTATPVTYSESVGGDLPLTGSPLPTFTLDVGVNSVSGTVSITASGGDSDSFAFVVPDGLEVNSAELVCPLAIGGISEVLWIFNAGSTNSSGGTFLQFVSVRTPGTRFFASSPLPAGSYNLAEGAVQFISTPAFADYSFTFNVAPVPEPTSLWLLGTAVLFLRRRRPLSSSSMSRK